MTDDEVRKLGTLARIALSDEEVQHFKTEIGEVLEYVSAVKAIAGDDVDTKVVGARYNVFRPDEVTNEPGAHTKALLDEMPHTERGYLKVKKILDQDT